MGLILLDTQQLIAELLRNAAAICAHNGFSIEDFVHLAAAAYATDQGEVLDEFVFDAVLSERPPSN